MYVTEASKTHTSKDRRKRRRERGAPALAVHGPLRGAGKPSRLVLSLLLAPAASRDALERQMSGAQMRRW